MRVTLDLSHWQCADYFAIQPIASHAVKFVCLNGYRTTYSCSFLRNVTWIMDLPSTSISDNAGDISDKLLIQLPRKKRQTDLRGFPYELIWLSTSRADV